MKRLLPIILLLTLLSPVLATGVLPPIFVNKAAAPSSPSYAFAGTDFNTGGVGNVWTSTATSVASCPSNCLVEVNLSVQNNPALTMTVNGVSMTQAVVSTQNNQQSIWYGTLPSASGALTIVVTGGNFLDEAIIVYYANNLQSNTPRGTVVASGTSPTSGTISVNAGDFLFAGSNGGAGATWTSSTQTPSGTQSQTGTGAIFDAFSADWTIASTNASFSVAVTETGPSMVAANWR